MDALAAIVEKNGAPFDVVVDAVSSGDAVDAAHAYERRVLTHDNPPLLATGANSDPHNYVTIGAKFSGWVKAGLKRVAGVNAFPPRRELFWITFPNCANDLETLRALADEKGLRPSIETVTPESMPNFTTAQLSPSNTRVAILARGRVLKTSPRREDREDRVGLRPGVGRRFGTIGRGRREEGCGGDLRSQP